MVEHNLAKVGVDGSNPFARSKQKRPSSGRPFPFEEAKGSPPGCQHIIRGFPKSWRLRSTARLHPFCPTRLAGIRPGILQTTFEPVRPLQSSKGRFSDGFLRLPVEGCTVVVQFRQSRLPPRALPLIEGRTDVASYVAAYIASFGWRAYSCWR